MITIKKKLTEIKNVFDRLISRLTQTEKKKKNLWAWGYVNTNTQNKKAKRKKNKGHKLFKNSGTITKSNICVMEISEEEREKGAEELFEAIMTETFPKLM